MANQPMTRGSFLNYTVKKMQKAGITVKDLTKDQKTLYDYFLAGDETPTTTSKQVALMKAYRTKEPKKHPLYIAYESKRYGI
jgi:hypothetical protein|tara:strand:+ start:72 stop:317 length:246 start_codon:yes stop_codon:yes gene_type:complete